jgi:hypothetical protein
MSSSEPAATVRLTIRVADAGTEVFVSDPHFQPVGTWQANCDSNEGWCAAGRACYHQGGCVARTGVLVPAT